MTRHRTWLGIPPCLALMLAFMFVLPGIGGSSRDAIESPSAMTNAVTAPFHGAARVLNLWLLETNMVVMGTQTLSATQATSLLTNVAFGAEALVLYAPDASPGGAAGPATGLLVSLAQLGLPLLVVEEGGTLAIPTNAGTSGRPTLEISTDQLRAIRSRLAGRPAPTAAGDTSGPALRSRFAWDDAQTAYELRSLEFGLPGSRQVWFMLERKEDGTAGGGVQIKKDW